MNMNLNNRLQVMRVSEIIKKEIDWNDFQNYLLETAIRSSGKNSTADEESEKEYFARLANKCNTGVMDRELSVWYDNGNYRQERISNL
jgi:hypothetical protein